VEQPSEFWATLAQGTEHAARVYGGLDFAMAFGGNEMPGYHTGAAGYAGYLVGARHSHLCNGGYSIDQAALTSGKTATAEELARQIVKEEAWRQILTSLHVCFFARGVYTPDVVSRALATVGYNHRPDRPASARRRHLPEKYQFKLREGFSFDALRVPRRVLQTACPSGQIDEQLIRQTWGTCETIMFRPRRAGLKDSPADAPGLSDLSRSCADQIAVHNPRSPARRTPIPRRGQALASVASPARRSGPTSPPDPLSLPTWIEPPAGRGRVGRGRAPALLSCGPAPHPGLTPGATGCRPFGAQSRDQGTQQRARSPARGAME